MMKQSQPLSVRHLLMVLVFSLSLLTSALSSPINLQERQNSDNTNNGVPSPQTGPYNLTAAHWQFIVLGVICILTGLYFCLLGYRFFRLTMFFVGFWFFGNIMYIILYNAGVTDHTVLLIASIAIGIFLGLLLACCYQIGVYMLGALAGYTFALWLLSFRSGGLIPSRTGQIILIVVLVVIGVVLSIFLERFVIIVATSFIGAFLVIFGIDMFVNTGYAAVVNGLLNGQLSILGNETWQIYAMLAATFVLFLLSVAFQYATSWRTVGPNYNKGVSRFGVCGRCFGRRTTTPATTTRRSWWSSWRRR